MKKKWNTLAVCSLILALAIFAFTYVLYHYMNGNGCFVEVYQATPGKPFITLLFGIWGVMFLFSTVMSFLIGHVFYKE